MQNEELRKAGLRLQFYWQAFSGILRPAMLARMQNARFDKQLLALSSAEQQDLEARVDYYNKLDRNISLQAKPYDEKYLTEQIVRVGHFPRTKPSSYFLDLKRWLRGWQSQQQFGYQFGDVTEVPEQPCFVKSRPITDHNQNSVILKLDRFRHYYHLIDHVPIDRKKPQVVWRGALHNEGRISMVSQYFDDPLFDVGAGVKSAELGPLQKPFMPMRSQLDYQFVLCPEGNDVATNLKWVMASNSIAVMPKPRYETWFMEGQLEPGRHYIEVSDDYADAGEKIAYYVERPALIKEMVAEAKHYRGGFENHSREELLTYMVIKKYFSLVT